MERPYVTCHILSSLNGRISGPFMGMAAAAPALAAYGAIRSELEADAWLYGAATMMEFTGKRWPELSAQKQGGGKEPEDYVAEHSEDFYFVSLDGAGEVGWDGGSMYRGGKKAHGIEILTAAAPDDYRAYLRKQGVSYIQAGDREVDCGIALEKLGRLFGIRKLLVCGGGMADWTFLQQGAMDALSLVLAPAADGTPGPSVFDSFGDRRGEHGTAAAQFRLNQVKTLEGGALWMDYRTVKE